MDGYLSVLPSPPTDVIEPEAAARWVNGKSLSGRLHTLVRSPVHGVKPTLNTNDEHPAPAPPEIAPIAPPASQPTEGVGPTGGQHPGEIGVTWEMKGVDAPAAPTPPGHPGEIRVEYVLGGESPSGREDLHLEK